jgi:hypothetical protein
MDAADSLFAPCDRYALDPDLAFREKDTPSCVDCIEQYRPNHVCREFQARLLAVADAEGVTR